MYAAIRSLFIILVLALLIAVSPTAKADNPTPTPAPTLAPTQPATVKSGILNLTGVTSPVHDPTLVKEGGLYYLVNTGPGIPIHCSPDMLQWQNCGRVFSVLPVWVYKEIPGVGDLWAPDLVYWNGKWHLYYAASTFGSNRSAIGLATNITLNQDSKDYKWVDEGEVLASQKTDNFNAIDPNLTSDQSGQRWLVFGSFWSGIKMRKIDPATGKLAADDTTLYSLASHPGNTAIEGAYITYRDGYYYLFVSWDFCCRGVNSTYNIRVGRSDTITGPYADKGGKLMADDGGTLVYGGSDRWKGPGHNMVYVEDGTYWMVYHSYDAEANGSPTLRIEALEWDQDGWPISPSALATK